MKNVSNIVILKGDAIAEFKNGSANVFMHQCNCFNTMGAGIAKQVKDQLKDMFLLDQKTIKGDPSKLGKVGYVTYSGVVEKIGFNVYGQYKYGWQRGVVYTDYDALAKAFSTINRIIPANSIIATYKMGCNLAGADWNKVSEIMLANLNNGHTIKVFEK